ncbi:MAG: glycosyl hydrolase, partial [Anaerolineae bacterium]
SEGIHRVTWNLRYPSSNPVTLSAANRRGFGGGGSGPMAAPGTYRVSMALRVDGQTTPLGNTQSITTEALGTAALPAADRQALLTFQRKTARLLRAVLGAGRAVSEAQNRLEHIRKALENTPEAPPELLQRTVSLDSQLKDLLIKLTGDPIIRAHNAPRPPSITGRVRGIVSGHWSSTSAPTQTHREQYEIAATEFEQLLPQLQKMIEQDLEQLEAELEKAGAPHTPGRVPRWHRE